MTFSYKNNFVSILYAKKFGDKETIHEASLSRIWHHAQQSGHSSFAIMTSWRQNLNKKENLERFATLKTQIRNLGLGFNVLKGHWRECQDTTISYEECPEDQLVDAVEPSLFVSGIDLNNANKLGNSWEQDAIIYSGPETAGDVSLIFKDGSKLNLGKFSPNAISQAYSELKNGRTFKFEYVEWPTQGKTEALIEQSFRTKPLTLLSEMDT
jgi:hypothetical protein